MKKEYIVAILIIIGVSMVFLLLGNANRITGNIIANSPNTNSSENNYFVQEEPPKDEPADMFPDTTEYHWDHMPLNYKISEDCDDKRTEAIYQAFKKIENETDKLVYFNESENEIDILLNCDSFDYFNRENRTKGESYYLISSDSQNIIDYSEVKYYGNKTYDECGTGYPILEVHEILHSFNFGHNANKKSLMNPYTPEPNKCRIEKMDDAILECLRYTYSNGEIKGVCAGENQQYTNNKFKDYQVQCPEGSYISANDPESCCSEPNMTISGEDYCY